MLFSSLRDDLNIVTTAQSSAKIEHVSLKLKHYIRLLNVEYLNIKYYEWNSIVTVHLSQLMFT
jgi:hypothetical protein